MNTNIIHQIHFFYNECQKYQMSGSVFSLAVYLRDLSNEWLVVKTNKYLHSEEQLEIISNEIEKIIVQLIEKISNHSLSHDLISIFSEMVVSYMDQIASDEKKFEQLASVFDKMAITYHIPKKFEEELSMMKI